MGLREREGGGGGGGGGGGSESAPLLCLEIVHLITSNSLRCNDTAIKMNSSSSPLPEHKIGLRTSA